MIKNSRTPVPSPSLSTGVLFLDDVVFSINLGVTQEERAVPQEVKVSIAISYKNTNAQVSDDIEDAYCYDSLLNSVSYVVSNKEYKLIEHLCNDIAEVISARGYKSYKVKVTKRPLVLGQRISASFEVSR